MDNQFTEDVSILVDNDPLSVEFHIYEVGYEKCQPTKPFEYIPIDYWVLHYVMDGKGYFSAGNSDLQHLSVGDTFLLPANCPNIYYPDKADPWTYMWVGISGELTAKYLAQIGLSRRNFVINASIDKTKEMLFNHVYQAFKDKQNFQSLSAVYSLLDYLQQENHANNPVNQGKQIFDKILLYVDENFASGLTISQIAANNNVDRSYLYKLFQRYLGKKPSQYVHQLKLQKACSLLRKSSLNITQISQECGFSSSAYFTNVFAKEMNSTPLKYRNRFIRARN
ncbi:AraC family transcriptional regulator [Pediococcus acidilactici]|uniref:AraC family transcriptional regulator n=1 Tax=Pediococcus acidilactici TaxID=1254 RepID=UPI001CCD40BC|nr:AraC family transcriptional regulator [Pediococcus acidilactici]